MKIRLAFIVALILLSSKVLFGQDQANKTIKIKGTVVAEFIMLAHACYHVCGLTLIVKQDRPSPDKYVVVSVEYMDDHTKPEYGEPTQLTDRAARWEFEGTIDKDGSMRVERYMKFIDSNGVDISSTLAAPAWRVLKGAETEPLPFEESIKAYNVKVGKFRSLK